MTPAPKNDPAWVGHHPSAIQNKRAYEPQIHIRGAV
jgi:hypothetical protein